jgi:hypothetical protein
MANGSVSTHSPAGTLADSCVYTRMLNTVGSSMTGKNVTVDTICLRIERISAWISASGLLVCDLSQSTSDGANCSDQKTYSFTAPWDDCSTILMSKTHRSRGVLESLLIIATTSCVTAPESNQATPRVGWFPVRLKANHLPPTCFKILRNKLRAMRAVVAVTASTSRDNSPELGPG